MCKSVNIFVFWSYQCCAGALSDKHQDIAALGTETYKATQKKIHFKKSLPNCFETKLYSVCNLVGTLLYMLDCLMCFDNTRWINYQTISCDNAKLSTHLALCGPK